MAAGPSRAVVSARTQLSRRLDRMFLALLLVPAILPILQVIFSSSSSSSLATSIFFENDRPVLDLSASGAPPRNASFSACLLTMEDDFILPEWLAYHYTKLPLRRLIVAVDPRSRTSPKELLDRWDGRIDITEWRDRDYFPLAYRSAIMKKKGLNSTADRLTTLHRFRQRFFYFNCMRQLKSEGRTWVAMIDSDEFLHVPNPNWKWNGWLQGQLQLYQANTAASLAREKSWTVLDFLFRLGKSSPPSSLCVSLPRLTFGTYETSDGGQQTASHKALFSALSIEPSDLVTYRWVYHGALRDTQINKAGKVVLDVSRVPSFHFEKTDTHRPLLDYCSERGVWIDNEDSPIVVHHFIGDWLQWSSRQDPRGGRTRERHDTYNTLNRTRDDSVARWLDEFVGDVGLERGRILLAGAGRVSKEFSNASSPVKLDNPYASLGGPPRMQPPT